MPSLAMGLSLRAGLNNATFRPTQLFAASEPGIWLDPSDLTTLFQEFSGITPVTAAGQSVGLVLEKSQNLTIGSERLTNGDFGAGAASWAVSGNDGTHIVTFAGGTCRFQSDTTTPILAVTQSGVLTIGKTYLVTVVTSAWTSGSVKTEAFSSSTVLSSGVGTVTIRGRANTTTFSITRNSSNVDLTIDSITVKEIAGNHAFQTTAASRPTYQVDAYGRGYLSFDGVDDFLVTPTITPGIDKVQVFAGVRKLSDAAQGVVAELSASTAANNGSLLLAAPDGASATFAFDSKGTVQTDAVASSQTAPKTAVLTGLGDIAGDSAIIRVNGAVADTDTGDQGTGNYLAYPIYIGRRGGTTLPFNGQIYGLITRFGANLNTGQITSAEHWMNAKTGAY